MYQNVNKESLRGLLSMHKKALTFCHNSARFDLEKEFQVIAIPAQYMTEKKIASFIDMKDYVGVIFCELFRGSYRYIGAIHYSGMYSDGIMNNTFPERAYFYGIDTFYAKCEMEEVRKKFRKTDGTFYIVAQGRDLLRPASEFKKQSVACWHGETWRKAVKIAGDVPTDKSGYDRVSVIEQRLLRAEQLRKDRAKEAAEKVDTTHFRREMDHTIRECREMVADYILNYTHVSYETIPGALHTLIVLYEPFCSREHRNMFASPDIKRRNMDEIRKCADRVKALYAEWKAEQTEIA